MTLFVALESLVEPKLVVYIRQAATPSWALPCRLTDSRAAGFRDPKRHIVSRVSRAMPLDVMAALGLTHHLGACVSVVKERRMAKSKCNTYCNRVYRTGALNRGQNLDVISFGGRVP